MLFFFLSFRKYIALSNVNPILVECICMTCTTIYDMWVSTFFSIHSPSPDLILSIQNRERPENRSAAKIASGTHTHTQKHWISMKTKDFRFYTTGSDSKVSHTHTHIVHSMFEWNRNRAIVFTSIYFFVDILSLLTCILSFYVWLARIFSRPSSTSSS